MSLTATCELEHYNSLTNECDLVNWLVVNQGPFPDLTIQDSLVISGSILSILGLAFCFKLIRKFIFK